MPVGPDSGLGHFKPVGLDEAAEFGVVIAGVEVEEGSGKARVSDLLCMSNLVHASATKEHDNDDDYQGTFRRAAERR